MSIVRGPINLIILTDPKEASETKNLKVEIKKQKVQGSSEEKNTVTRPPQTPFVLELDHAG